MPNESTILNSNHLNDYTHTFAKYYDILNSDKQYKAESIEFNKIIKKYISGEKPKMADVGCGTGNYSIQFFELGYSVVGYDVSDEMIAIAKCKHPNIPFNCKPFESNIDKYEVIVSLFNVVNSLGDYDQLIRFLSSISDGMAEDAIFIFDMWNGVAVFKYPPQIKTKIIQKDGVKIVREVVPDELDYINQISVMAYNMQIYHENEIVETINPKLVSNFFTYNEMIRALRDVNLYVVQSFASGKVDEQISEKDWKINFVCKKTKLK